jgi:hypothetical protein
LFVPLAVNHIAHGAQHILHTEAGHAGQREDMALLAAERGFAERLALNLDLLGVECVSLVERDQLGLVGQAMAILA